MESQRVSSFKMKIRSAIADQSLQAALDKNAEQRLKARAEAYQGLPEDFKTLKKKAHDVRTDVIVNLDDYLGAFMDKVQENGFILHRAANAAEARTIVLQIAQDHNAKLISKSKTMMSEEIELNPALDAAGIRVVETDLGEYIVQLRGEHPSHIITPAVHLRKEDVGITFHEKLGIPLTDDIQILTNTARARLRQTFLDTDIGISGVNMGVVETGDLCIVTNEGNGRMVTTLPPVHIALMGIERLVPDTDSLALILTLLPRSATGQHSTVYTQLISRPRQADETDGASERHLVLIDNGRSELRLTPLAEALNCIRCGACINACPVFREIGGYSYTSKDGDYTPYPGPIGSVLSPGLFGQANFGHLAQASTLCGACKEACPVDIDLPTMLLRVRSGRVGSDDQYQKDENPMGISTPISWGLHLFTWTATRPRFFSVAQKMASFFGKIWSPRKEWMQLPAITGWGTTKDFPRPAGKTFRERWKEVSSTPMAAGITSLEPEQTIEITPHQQSNSQEAEPLVTRFRDALQALGGHFFTCNQAELVTMISSTLARRNATEILSWDSAQLPAGLVEDLNHAGIKIQHDPDSEIRVGLTGAQAAIANTGTVVLTSGTGQPLSVSLLPETHIVVLQEDVIYENLPQVLRLQEIRDASSTVMISGPSRTADIEMTLTIGVHGPGEIIVFCVRA